MTRCLGFRRGGAPTDPDRIALRRAARVMIVGVPLFVIFEGLLDMPEAGIPAVFAALSLGARADFAGPLPRRALRYAYAGLASLAMMPLGAALAGHDVALVIVTGVIVFLTMFLGTLGGPFFAARFPVVLSLLFATTAGKWGSTLPDRMIGWGVGTVAIAIAAIVLWPLRPRRLSDPSAAPGPTFDAIRIGVALERLAWLATWEVDARARQPPTVTGTFE